MNKLLKTLLTAVIIISMSVSCTSQTKKDSENYGNTGVSSPSQTDIKEIRPIRDISSSELLSEIKIGWNLGNTMDSTTGKLNESPEKYETGWGNAITTQEIIDQVSDAGFNIIRIPISWGEHLSSDDTYTIDEAWLKRVGEIVDYCINNNMFVILNTHHENWIFPDNAHFEQNSDELKKIWTQIGNYFEGYDEKLIFEGMNEPRKIGTASEWNGGDDEGHEVINKLNQVFVDTIRGLGGNNPKRHLMIPTYAASSTDKAIRAMTIPAGDDKLIVSVHAYIPYNFALAENGTAEWSDDAPSCTQEMDNLFSTLKTTFIDKGTPVIIGEMGAVSRDNNAVRAEWSKYYISHARAAGIPCIWWDNGTYLGGDNAFGLLSRKSCRWIYRDVVDGLMEGLK